MTTGRSLRLGEAVLGWRRAGAGAVRRLRDLAAAGRRQPRRGGAAPVPVPGRRRAAPGRRRHVLREAFFGHVAHEGGFELDWLAVVLVSVGLIVADAAARMGWAGSSPPPSCSCSPPAPSEPQARGRCRVGLVLAALTFVVFSYGLDLSLPRALASSTCWRGGERSAAESAERPLAVAREGSGAMETLSRARPRLRSWR